MNASSTTSLLLFLALLMLSACGGTQSSSQAADGTRAIDYVFDGSSFETITVDSAIRSRNLATFGSATYTRDAVLVLRVTEPTSLELVAQSTDNDTILLVLGPDLPYQDDDTYGYNPAIATTFQPGVYRVYVGMWGMPPRDIPFTLSIYDSKAGQHPDLTKNASAGEGPQAVEVPQDWNSAEIAAEYADIPTPSEEATVTIDGANATSGQYDVTLTPGARTHQCEGVFDFERPVAVLNNLQELRDSRLQLVLNRHSKGNAVDTIMAVYQNNELFACVDDFVSFFAGQDFSASDGENGPLYVYGGIYNAASLNDSGQVDIGVRATVLSASDWRPQSHDVQAQDTPQSVGIKGKATSPFSALSEDYYGYVRDTDTPDAILHVRKNHSNVQIDARLQRADSILFVQGPDGTFQYNDDRPGSIDSRLVLTDASKGDYKIWIGTFAQNASLYGQLTVRNTGSTHTSNQKVIAISAIGEEGQLTTRASNPTNTTGDNQICDGFAMGYLDMSAPSALFKNDSGMDAYLIVRSQSEADAMLYARGANEDCGDDEIDTDAVIALPVGEGETVELFAGGATQSDAKKPILLRYMLLTEDMSGSDIFLNFVSP